MAFRSGPSAVLVLALLVVAAPPGTYPAPGPVIRSGVASPSAPAFATGRAWPAASSFPVVPRGPAGAVPRGPAGVLAVGDFRWPLDGVARVVRRFDPPPQPWLPGHRGVDLAAAPGAVVRSAGPGTVSFAGAVAGRPVVTVRHRNGLRTTYEPVDPLVRAGTEVAAGAPIGRLRAGHPGCEEAACLHWGLRRADGYLDPLTLLALGRVRLLPV
ncbi:murein hydrolase activator EnvC family protein [Plantactinospora siamensis]|uniref:Murein hydrolase activator EnvC family protein n=1 Tax=Plantactinospora siamensis TaxID=555372 RepID=A0ABV6NSW7_9ACTN